MEIIVGVITTAIVVLLFVLLMHFSKKKTVVSKAERSMPQIQYLLFLALPIASLIIIGEYVTISPLLCSLLWILIILVIDKIFTRKMLLSTSTKTKETLVFLAMFLCVVYFIAQGVAEKSWEYIGMFSVAGALIIGFFVPLDVILSETYMKNKLSEIAKGIGLLRLEKTTLIFYVVILLCFVGAVVIENTQWGQNIKVPASIGAVVGFTISLIILSIRSKGINDSIKDCTDYREKIFESQEFIDYKCDIEDRLQISHQDLYDHVEAFLFYQAFSSKDAERLFISEKAERRVYENIQKDFQHLGKYRLYSLNESRTYILKNGHKEYAFSCIVNPWRILISYINKFGEINLDNGEVPQEYKNKYKNWGYEKDEEVWLLYFLEKYHFLTRKKRKSIVPDELRTLLYYVYKEQALWIVPKRCIDYFYNNDNAESYNAFCSFDMTLEIVYEWYIKKANGENTRDYLLRFVGKDKLVNAFESWLGEYEDWESFVISNKLGKFVKKRISWKSYGLNKPKKVFHEEIFNEISNKDCLKEFKRIANLIYYRY